MIKIYHAQHARSLRIIWLMEELGQEYTVETLQFAEGDLKKPEFLKIHPMGKVPAIDDNGFIMYESGAIVEYLLGKFGDHDLVPARSSRDYGRYLQWFHFAEATMTMHVGNFVQHTALRPEEDRIPKVAEENAERVQVCLGLLDKELLNHDYITGNKFSAADIMVGYALHLANLFGLITDEHPKVQDYYERLKAREAYQKAAA